MIQAFERDEIKVGYIGLPPAIIGISRGKPLVCIGGGHVEGTMMVAGFCYKGLADLGSLESVLRQFSHRRVGIPARGSIHDVIFRNLLMQHHCPDVEIINFDWADLIPNAILKGEINAAVGTPPLAVLCKKECKTHVVIPPEELWPFNPSYGIVVQREILADRALVEGFLVLHERVCNLIRKAPEGAAEWTVRALPWLDKDFVRKVYAVSPRYCASLPPHYIQSTMDFLPVLKSMGYVDTLPRQEEIFEARFINKIHSGPHHY
jgi:NitT/TauT family transport system substrate-binding protein